MKSKIYFLAVISLSVFLLSGCAAVQVPKFTSVENVFKLTHGSSLEKVVSVLGSQPYDFLSSQVDGYSIYRYKYKLLERKAHPSLLNQVGGETTGVNVYNSEEKDLFLVFKEDKLQTFYSTEGRKQSENLILLNNTLYIITKDKENYILKSAEFKINNNSFLDSDTTQKKRFLGIF